MRSAAALSWRQEPPQLPQDTFNAPLYTLKAFAIVTAIVVSITSTSGSIAGVMAYLGVRNVIDKPFHSTRVLAYPQTTEFAAHPTFDHDAAEQRLVNVFDKGGFDS
ncbi:hypothetical protein OG21DRAFT_1487329 [Imleria badia]|nr:hypothetical protein OG21DRAFT_1487329 [Imleria badia]